jgi:hypothetical protein
MFEYISPDGTALPENEVIKLASKNGLSLKDYIKKNKITERSKQKKKPQEDPYVTSRKKAQIANKAKTEKPSFVDRVVNTASEFASDVEEYVGLAKYKGPATQKGKPYGKELNVEEAKVYKAPIISNAYSKPGFDQPEAPKVIKELSETPEMIDLEIKKERLDLKDPYLSYSNSKNKLSGEQMLPDAEPDFVQRNYSPEGLQQLGVNIDDFDGYLNKSGHLKDYAVKRDNGLFSRNWFQRIEDNLAIDDDYRLSDSPKKTAFAKEKLLESYLTSYLNEKDRRATKYRDLQTLKGDKTKDWRDVQKAGSENPVETVDKKLKYQFYAENFPVMWEVTKKKLEESKKYVEELKTNTGAMNLLNTVSESAKGFVGGMWNSTQGLINTSLDLVGLDAGADRGRAALEYEGFIEPDTKSYGFIDGKSGKIDGVEYLVDSSGNLYNTTNKFSMAGVTDPEEYNKIKEQIVKTGKQDYSVSTSGSAKNLANTLGAMVPQIALAEVTAIAGTRALAGVNGFTSVAEYKNMVALSEAIGGQTLSKMPMGITKAMGNSIIAQSAFGYSNGYEDTFKAAKAQGLNDKEAQAIAQVAGKQMGLLYAATAPLSPQIKAQELIFGSAKKRLIQAALNDFKTNGTKGFINTLNKGIGSIARGATRFAEEGTKETVQENIQQLGEVEVVNKNINEQLGAEILKQNYTYQDFVNTSALSFLSGGLIANAKLPNFSSDPDQRLIDLYNLGKDPNELAESLDLLVKGGSATAEEAERLKKASIAVNRQIRTIPKNTSPDLAIELAVKLDEVKELEDSKKTIAKPFHGSIDEKIKTTNTEITEIYNRRLDEEIGRLKTLTSQASDEKFEGTVVGEGAAYMVIDTKEEADSIAQDWFVRAGRESELTKKDENGNTVKIDFLNEPAITLPNGQIIINREIAREVDEGGTSGRHELLHKILRSQFINPEKSTELLNKFKATLSKKENAVVQKRLAERGYDEEYQELNKDEYLTQFFEALEAGEIKASDASFLNTWRSVFRPVYNALGFAKLDFTSGSDAYQFLKDYHKTSKKGVLRKRQKKLLEAGYNEPGRMVSSKAKVDEIQKKIDKLEEQYDNDQIEYDYYENQITLYEEQLAKAKLEPEPEKPKVEKPKVAVTEEEVVREIIKNEKGTIASDKVQKIYEEKGEQGANEIIKLFKPITAKIVAKRRDAPGFNEEELTKEIELGAGGLFDLIRKFDASKGVPLAAYINKNLPLRAITASRRVLDKEFTSDVEAEVNVRATETADQGMTVNAPEKPKYKDAIESNILEPKVLETVTNKIISTVRLLKSRIDAPVTLNRTVTPLIAEIRDEIGKQLDIDIKTMLGGKKDGVLRKELLKAKRYILENMTTTWLMGKDGQGGIPQAIQKRIDGKWVNFPNWVGQKIDREAMSTDLAGRTSGAELVRRLPNVFNNVSNEEFLAQIIGPDGNPIRGRKESISKAMAEEIAFDITKRDLEEEGSIYDALKANQERLGVEVLENLPVVFAKQADRGNIKLSKSVVKGINISTTKLAEDIFNAPDLQSEIKVINNWIASDGRSIRTLAYTLFGKDDERATNLGLFKQIIAPIIKVNSKFEGLLTKDAYNIKQGARGYSIYLGEDKIPLWKDTESIKKNWKNNIGVINSEAIEATNRLVDIVNSFKKGKRTEDDLRSYFAVLKFDQRGLARKVSKAGLGVLGLKANQKPYLEHNAPNYDIMEKFVDYFNKKITEKQLRKFVENSKVNLVPAELNNFLPAYKEGMNRMHAPKVVLYLQGLIDKGHTILNLENEYGSKRKFNALVNLAKSNVNSDANINNANNINAVANSPTFSKTPKGISVFDFDDTVGLTKGSVLYTMSDGSTGKLNAEEFAKTGSSLLSQGAVFDFSEFSKVVGGKPGPMVEKMKKMIGKFGPDNFFILTARPANAAGPIHEFLKSIDINIPLENITGLGNSTAQAKADWITAKAAEGYNDFYFADDAIQNVEAVKKALDIPGVDSKVQQAMVKFSLTSKQDLKWDYYEDSSFADFKVKGKSYKIELADVAYIDYPELLVPTINKLIEKYNLNKDDILQERDRKTYQLVFEGEKGDTGITGVGNAAETFGVVINGVIEYAKDNNTETFVFAAKEQSRRKLYNAMANVIANKMGWNAFYENGVYIVSKKGPVIETTAFNNQSSQVKNVLNVVDIKSTIQQNKIKFSKTISPEFNKILEENVGVKADEKFSDIVAKRKGAAIGKYRFFVPPSAADLELLTYDFLGYGQAGETQQEFFNKALFEPYANGIALIDAAKQSIKNDYKALLKAFPEVSKELGKLTPDGNFTYDQALRVSMWAGMGEEIPGLLKEDITKLNDFVNQDPQLSAFKAGLIATGRQGTGWVIPTEYWDSETIISDLHNITDKVGRKKYLAEFIENSKEMFSKENLNKIETIYGSNFRDALEDVIYRMSNGTNRESGPGRINAAWLNWINNSTGAIMFWNTRSAVLQTIGAINYLNWRDNNPLNAAKAFANQPQYWKDFSYIWNSDKMKERRSGLKEDVSSAEIANAAAGATNKANAIISYLLKKGFLPTQIGDSFAIASGGAAFYRNRINYNLKQGMSEAEAEADAWKEFLKVTDQTQQSGDPRDVSQQQASVAGRLVLAFQNTSMQQARLVKKAGLDLINRRGDAKTNISKIVYYTAVQNIIFGGLQSALFATLFSDDDDEEKEKKKQTAKDKWLDIGNNIVDTILRGSGLAGAVVATLKNVYLKYNEESEKGFKADYAKVLIEAANVAPPLGSKFTKAYGAMRTVAFEKDVIAKRGWSVTADGRLNLSPAYTALGQGVEAATNLPINRFVTKVNNLSEAMDSRNKSWQRIALAVGYNPYVIGAKNEENDIIKAEAKVQRKIEGKKKSAETRKRKKEEFKNLPESEKIKIRKQKLEEKRAKILAKRNIYK